ncbi:MAG: hypothetical protein IPK82_31790 [Polyangiaceae bacterium]|nr:hypothetical protein [Polyangiaceae bacterium]
MNFKSTLFAALVAASACLSGCGAIDVAGELIESAIEDDHSSASTPAALAREEVCLEVAKNLAHGEALSLCDVQIAADCEDVLGILSDPIVEAIAACSQATGSPAECFAKSTYNFVPTEEHYELVDSYCNKCLFGVDGCEELFYPEEGEKVGLGMVLLPWSDDVIDEIEDECTSDLTCSVDLPKCAEETVLKRLLPENTLRCLMESLKD